MNSTSSVRVVPRVLVLLALAAPFVLAPAVCNAEEIAIEIAPNTLNLQSKGVIVTVHTDIAYGAVDVSTVYINGVPIDWWKADNQGNFVAKFLMDDIKLLDGLIIGGYNTLKIVGLTIDDEPFWGEQEIMVIDVVGNTR